MTSFIEVPQLAYSGEETQSVYVNVADIITISENYDGGTTVQVRDVGTENGPARYHSYLPLGLYLNLLGELAAHPGVKSWADITKKAHRGPHQERIKAARAAERRLDHSHSAR